MDSNVAASPLTFFAAAAITWHLRNAVLERWPEDVHRQESALWRDLSYYLKMQCTGSAKERQGREDKKNAAEEKPKPDTKGDAAEKRKAK